MAELLEKNLFWLRSGNQAGEPSRWWWWARNAAPYWDKFMRSRVVDRSIWGWSRGRVYFQSCWNDSSLWTRRKAKTWNCSDLNSIILIVLHCCGCLKCPVFSHKAAPAGRKTEILNTRDSRLCAPLQNTKGIWRTKRRVCGVSEVRTKWDVVSRTMQLVETRGCLPLFTIHRGLTDSQSSCKNAVTSGQSHHQSCRAACSSLILVSLCRHVETNQTKRLSCSSAQKLGIMMKLTWIKCRVNTTKTDCTVLF